MPWHIAKTEECPASKPWGVIKDDDGEVAGCHETEEAAKRQMAALYAQEALTSMEHKSFDLIETKADDEAGHFTALASVFGNVDLVGDRMMPGAFKKTLEEKRQKNAVLPIVFSHAWDDPMKFIGEADTHAVLETEEGLLVQGKLDINNGNPVADQVHKAMKKGWITDWSFGFTVRDGGEKTVKGVNEITDVDLIEAGPTLKGANPEAQLQIVKSLPAEVKELPEDVTADKGVQEQDPPESLPQTLDPLREQSRRAILEIASGTKATHEPTVTDEERELRRRSREAMLNLMR